MRLELEASQEATRWYQAELREAQAQEFELPPELLPQGIQHGRGHLLIEDPVALTEAIFQGGKIVCPIAFSSHHSAPALSAPQGRRRQLKFERCHDVDLTCSHLRLATDYHSRHRNLTDPQDTSTKTV